MSREDAVVRALDPPSAMVEAAAVLLEAAGGGLLTTQLVKALFYLDLDALLETGKTVTGATWIAMRAGPVVDDYKTRLIGDLEHYKIALQEDDVPDYKPIVLLHQIEPHLLGDDILAMARNRGAWAKRKSATTLSVLSHKNPGWIAAWNDAPGSAINMHLAIQQVGDEDPWMKEPWTDEEKERLTEPDHEDFVEW